MRKLSQTLRVALALFLTVFSTSVIPAAAADAWTKDPTQDPGTNTKAYVCKMVGKPGADERFQTRQNPIAVDRGSHSYQIGQAFVDGQDDSFVVGFGYPSEPQDQQPQLSDCINMVTPSPSIATDACAPGTTATDAVTVTVTNNDQVVGNTAAYTVTVGSQTQTSSALTDGQSQTLTFSGLAAGVQSVSISVYGQVVYTGSVTVNQCQERTKVPVPATPAITDACNPTGITDNITWKTPLPTNTAQVSWTLSQDGKTLTASLTDTTHYEWSDGSTAPKTFTLPADSGVMCPPTLITPGTPTVDDQCGTKNDTYTLPTTEHITYTAVKHGATVVVTARADAGYALELTNHSEWTLNPDGTATYELQFSDQPCQTACTLPSQTYIQPWNYANTTYPEAGAYPSGTPGAYQFVSSSSITGLNLNTPATESYVDGLINAGNRPLSAISTMSYKTYRDPSSTGDNRILPAYILEIDKDGNPTTNDTAYLFYEPLYNGTVQTGVWQTWDAYSGGAAKWWGAGDPNPDHTWNQLVAEFPDATVIAYGFNQGTYNAGANTYVQHLVFDCATTDFSAPGKGSVTPPSTTPPQASGSPVKHQAPVTPLPAELPHTGPAENNFFLIAGLLIAVITYGAVYFAQPKRQYE